MVMEVVMVDMVMEDMVDTDMEEVVTEDMAMEATEVAMGATEVAMEVTVMAIKETSIHKRALRTDSVIVFFCAFNPNWFDCWIDLDISIQLSSLYIWFCKSS